MLHKVNDSTILILNRPVQPFIKRNTSNKKREIGFRDTNYPPLDLSWVW